MKLSNNMEVLKQQEIQIKKQIKDVDNEIFQKGASIALCKKREDLLSASLQISLKLQDIQMKEYTNSINKNNKNESAFSRLVKKLFNK